MKLMPHETAAAITRALLSGMQPLRSFVPLTLSQWAEKNFYLSAESSHTQGAWQAYPFQRGWMDAFSNDDIEEVTVVKAKRVGYTKTLLAFIAYNAAHRRRKQALWQPTDDDRDSFVKSEVDPMLRDVAVMQSVKVQGKHAEDTMKFKSFLGSVLHILGGKAARAYRRITVAVAMLDEADGFDQKVEKSADPITLARGRLEGAPFPKLIVGSTPRIKGQSHVEYRRDNAGAVLKYHIICPDCSADHPLEFGGKDSNWGFKWQKDDPSSVVHRCPHCLGTITQSDYLRIWGDGSWISKDHAYRYTAAGQWVNEKNEPTQPPRHVAFDSVWTAYSPQREWSDIVREFLEAKTKAKQGDTAPLEGFVNETLGQVWEQAVERTDEHVLARRAEDYRLKTCPLGVLVLVAGVDTQDNRWHITVWGVGRGEEMWVIDRAEIYGNPAIEEEWSEKLDPFLGNLYPHASGQVLPIEGMGVDTQGHFTHQAYNYCRQRERRRVFALRGDPAPGKPIGGRSTIQDVNHRGKLLKRGVKLWYVGADTAKDLIYGRLQVTTVGAGYMHFSKDLPPEFYAQLTSESRVEVRTAKGTVYRWENLKRARNEDLDCTVYALFVTHRLGLHNYTSAMWQKLENAVQPATPSLFSEIQPTKAPASNGVRQTPALGAGGKISLSSTIRWKK